MRRDLAVNGRLEAKLTRLIPRTIHHGNIDIHKSRRLHTLNLDYSKISSCNSITPTCRSKTTPRVTPKKTRIRFRKLLEAMSRTARRKILIMISISRGLTYCHHQSMAAPRRCGTRMSAIMRTSVVHQHAQTEVRIPELAQITSLPIDLKPW
jgi:hypothetical protein